jgi:serine/threonine protein kinase
VLEEWVAQSACTTSHVAQGLYATQRPRDAPVRRHGIHRRARRLARWMMDHPAPDLDSVRSLAAQVAKGLQAFHSKEMLHQDLRPENIMIDRSGTAKIIDFGATHVAGLTEGLTDWPPAPRPSRARCNTPPPNTLWAVWAARNPSCSRWP